MRLRNEDSGFCVLRVKARGQRDLITIIGHAATIGAGEFMRASTHGVQFRADFLRSAPTTSWLSAIRTCEHVYRIWRSIDCQSVCTGGPLPDQRIGEPKPHCVRSRARGSTSTSRFAQLRSFTLLYANNLTSLR
jgi:hypothetical protein